MTGADPTPEQEAEISHLLADAAQPVITPPEVAGRLDEVLASLVAERADAPPGDAPSAVVPLRRRRRWPQALVAAAAVVVAGYAGSNLVRSVDAGSSGDFDSKRESSTPADVQPYPDRPPAPQSTGARNQPRASGRAPTAGTADSGALALDERVQSYPLLAETFGLDFASGKGPAAAGSARTGALRCARPPTAPGDIIAPVGSSRTPTYQAVIRDADAPGAHVVSVYSCREALFPVASFVLLG